MDYFFKKPSQVPPHIMNQIESLIQKHGGVGKKFIHDNLLRAYLIGYAMDQGKVIGISVHKHQDQRYQKRLESLTGLDLTGYLERGYTTVAPEYRGHDIADRLIKGLIERSKGKKIYVTIRMDNPAPIALAKKNGMKLVVTFRHHKTGNLIGLFTNQGENSITH